MSLPARLTNTRARWSSQFGLYKYSGRELNDTKSNSRNFRTYFKYAIMSFFVLVSIITVCLMSFDFTKAVEQTLETRKSGRLRQGRNIDARGPNVTVADNNPSETQIQPVEVSTISTIEERSVPEKLFRFQTNPIPFQKPEYNPSVLNFAQLSNYRSAERVKNLHQLIRYMNEQFKTADGSKPNPNRRIKFSGIYLRPISNQNNLTAVQLNHKTSEKPAQFKKTIRNDDVDFLDQFKPTNVGDINLLAERQFRFSPSLNQNHPINDDKFDYDSSDVDDYDSEDRMKASSSRISPVKKLKGHNRKRPFSVMLDIYPMENEDEDTMEFPEHLKEPITTTKRPRTKFTTPFPNYYFPPVNYPNQPESFLNYYPGLNYYPPEYYQFNRHGQPALNKPPFIPKRIPVDMLSTSRNSSINRNADNSPTKMLVHLNLYPRRKIVKNNERFEVLDRKSSDLEFGKVVFPTDRPKNDSERAAFNITNRDNYGFKFPESKEDGSDLTNGISKSAINLLTLARDVELDAQTIRQPRTNDDSSTMESREIPENTIQPSTIESFVAVPLID